MPRSQNDSWLQKSLKSQQRGLWCLPELSSGHFLWWLFWSAFFSFFQKSHSSCQQRSTFHQMLWHSSAQCHRGLALVCSGACSTSIPSEAAELLLKMQQKHPSCRTACTKAILQVSEAGQPTCHRQGMAWCHCFHKSYTITSVSPQFRNSFSNLLHCPLQRHNKSY